MPHFWTKGADDYGKALWQEYEAAKQRLEARLKQCHDPSQQQAIRTELAKLKEDFRSKRSKIRRSLFGVR